MSKRILSCLLCVILLVSVVPVSAQAEEIAFYQILIDAGDGVQTEKAIIEGDEIYIAATSFSKYTRFEFDEATQTFLVKGQTAGKAFKKVIVNAEMKKAAVGTKLIELENSFVVDGVAYLPFCQMLPILNADIIEVDSGIIYLVNNELSMAELLYDFDINDYWFNISEEFFGRTDLLYWYIAPSYLFDTVVNFRFDRLDIVFESGTCEDYQTILTDYLKDDELFHKAMAEEDFAGDLLESITGLTGITGKLDDVYDWFEKIEKIDYDPMLSDKLVEFIQKTNSSEVFDDQLHTWIEVIHGDIVAVGKKEFSAADILEGIDFLYTYLNQVEDHQQMLDAVYGIVDHQKKFESIPGASSSFTSVDPEYLAAEQVYELYTGNIIPAITKKTVEKAAEELLEDFVAVKTLGMYSLTASLAGEILELYLPGDSGDRALLPQHSNIANSAMRKAAVPTLDTEESTDEYRLSLLLTLLASRACYDIMAETASGYGQDDAYYQRKIDEIENMIMGLYLVAENVAFDTYENYEIFTTQNKDIVAQSSLLDAPTEYESFQELLFDDTYWVWTKGPTNGSVYVALFHSNGIMEYCQAASQSYEVTAYDYNDGILTIDGIEYAVDGHGFVSVEKHEAPTEPDGTYYTISPDDNKAWRSLLDDVINARESLLIQYQNALQIGRKLMRVHRYSNGGGTEYVFNYNGEGLLINVTETDYGAYENDYMPGTKVTTLTYDSNNKITGWNSGVETDWGYAGEGAEYTYNSDGQIISSRYGVTEGGGCNVTYNYDLLGYTKEISTVFDICTYEYSYCYDYTTKSLQLVRSDWLNADIEGPYRVYEGNEWNSITYENKPFVTYDNGFMSLLDQNGNGNAINYDTGTLLYYFEFYEPQYFRDNDGYLVKVIDGNEVYEFFYE